MGKITHKDAADMSTSHKVSEDEWKANATHLDSQGNALELSRSAALVVAANDSSAKGKAGADYVCDGTADEVEINAALATAADKDVLCLAGTYYINAPVTITVSTVGLRESLTFADGAVIIPSADVDLFRVNAWGCLRGGIVRADSFAGYTSTVITAGQRNCLVENMELRGTEGTGTGTAIKLAPYTTATVAYNRFDSITIYGFEYGILLDNGAQVNYYNTFTHIYGTKVVHFIREAKGAGDMHANWYEFSYQAFGDGNDTQPVLYIAGRYNRIIGIHIADFNGATSVEVLSGSDYNMFDIRGGATWSRISNSGSYNTFFLGDAVFLVNRFGLNIVPQYPQAHIADLKTNFVNTDVDSAAEIASALNTAFTKVNTLLADLEGFGFLLTP